MKQVRKALEENWKALAKAPSRAAVVTIACQDRPETVRASLTRNRFTFPVWMADERTEAAFSVAQYPSRRLLTPSGRLITLPDRDWQLAVRTHVFREEALPSR